jgi:hypothetical protein
MSPHCKSGRELSVLAAATLLVLVGARGPLHAGPERAAASSQEATVVASERAAAIAEALKLLPRRPGQLALIDPAAATPKGREILAKADAFITKGGRVVYVNLDSEVLTGARRGSPIHLCMLAAIIWHEMAHIDGADEDQAQRREEGLWKRFLLDDRVDRVTALRYLKLMTDRHQ